MPKEKKIKVKYETEASYRWGLCMKLAKVLYRSGVSTGQIEASINDVEEWFSIPNEK